MHSALNGYGEVMFFSTLYALSVWAAVAVMA